jgi:hypothetical protein
MLKRIVLTDRQKEYADSIAAMRHVESLTNRRTQTDIGEVSDHEKALKSHILGARGQLAASLATGIPWTPKLGLFKDANLGDRYKVRTVDAFYKKLIVAEDAELDLIYLLVVSTGATTFHLIGWRYGRDCVAAEVKPIEGKPAHFVPRSWLKPMATMPLPAERKPVAAEGGRVDEKKVG